MTAQNLGCLKEILTQNHRCVVVSAVGKEHPSDAKTTDLLIAHYNGANVWKQIEQKYKRLVQVNGVRVDVEKLLFDAKRRSLKNGLAYCMSLGEELSAKIAAAFLNCAYVEAESCIRFDNRGLQWKATKRNLQSAFSGLKIGVVGGFYGGLENGRQVFSRGGGDVSGAICAVATGSSLYENFTDVNGVCTANPKIVPFAQTVPSLSYNEMYLLAKNGAEVLHPDAVRFAQRRGVAIRVANYLNANAPSTIISNCPSGKRFLSATQKQTGENVVTTVLHTIPWQTLQRYLLQVFEILQNNASANETLWCKADGKCVQMCTKHSVLSTVHDVFCKANDDYC